MNADKRMVLWDKLSTHSWTFTRSSSAFSFSRGLCHPIQYMIFQILNKHFRHQQPVTDSQYSYSSARTRIESNRSHTHTHTHTGCKRCAKGSRSSSRSSSRASRRRRSSAVQYPSWWASNTSQSKCVRPLIRALCTAHTLHIQYTAQKIVVSKVDRDIGYLLTII